MVGPDAMVVTDYDRDVLTSPVRVDAGVPMPAPAGGGARAFTCEGHSETVRAFLERHYQPRRMAYRDGRP
jgi:hypothetical protein